MATADVQSLLLRIDASTELARRELVKLDGPLEQVGATSEVAARRFNNSMTQIERSSGRVANAQRNLGFQIQDISVQLASGTSAFTVFAQQAGQTASAVAEFGGTVGKLGTFLAGPWGSILIAATSLIGNFAISHFRAAEAAEEQRKKEEGLTKELTKRQKLEAQNPITAAQGRAQRIIDQLPAGSAIRALEEREFNQRFGMNTAGLIREEPVIEVTASRTLNPRTPKPKKARAPKTPETFTPANMESGFELRQLLDGGVSAQAEIANRSLQGVARTLTELQTFNFSIDPIPDRAVEAAEQFNQNLARGLGQAIIMGQSLGDALVNSIKAAAAELITSGLLRLLSGGAAGGGVGGVFASLFGGFFATGGRPPMGRVSVVGERGPELFVPSVPGEIIPNYKLAGAMGGGQQGVNVSVEPSPLFITTVTQGAAAVARDAAGAAIASASRRRMTSAMGA